MGVPLIYMAHDAKTGKTAEKSVDLGVEVYQLAQSRNMTLRQYMNHICPDADPAYGHPLDQMATNACLNDGKKGFGPAMTINELSKLSVADGLRRPDGSDNSLGARLLYPQIILETLNARTLTNDDSDILDIWEGMIATTRNIAGQRAEQPIIDTRGPEGSRSGRIAQLAQPETMITITTSQKSYAIPKYSIGLTISQEALQSTTIDLVTTVMSAQARGERIARAKEQMRNMVLGDVDLGIAALPVTKIGTYDPKITEDGVITRRAYIKWLLSQRDTAAITRILTDIDVALDLDEAFLPTQTGVDSSKVALPWGGFNLGLPQPQVLPLDEGIFGADLIVGLDPRYAIQRFVDITAPYDAIEEFVMRKAVSFRVDFGEMATRLYDQAWSVVSLEKA